ncbi:MAG: class I SAM-dependent methyltransferase [Clostridia bacterium]|nr:class I SAM-dependent methyltransferase [Clostridia bacterium]
MDLKKRNLSMQTFFNERVDGYDNAHANLMESKECLTHTLPEHTKTVLDLGAGTGLELTALFARFPEAQVTAVDISEKMLELLRARPFGDRVTCVAGDFFEVPFGDGFDAVISTSALHHFTRADKAVLYTKVYRALKPGGLFINSDWVAGSQEEEDERFLELEENPQGRSHIDTPLTIENERLALTEAGFEEIEFRANIPESYTLSVARKH